MRILFATNFFPPTHNAGIETYTYGLAHTLREDGHTVTVVCAGTFDEGNSHIPQATTDTVDGISVTRLHFNWQRGHDLFMDLADNYDVGMWFAEHLRMTRPDVIHVQSCDTLSTSVISIAKEMNIPVIVTLSDYWFLCMRHTLLKGDGTRCDGPESPWECLKCLAHDAKVYRLPHAVLPERVVRTGLQWASTKPMLTRQHGVRGVLGNVAQRQATVHTALLKADIILTPSPFFREMYVRNGYPPERIHVSPYGLECGWVPADTEKTNASELRIGYLGQIEPMKGVDVLVRAFRGLTSPKLSLTIHGNESRNPSYTRYLRSLANGDCRIRFAGLYSRAERADILRNVDVVVVPSRWYDLAFFVIGEAQAMKTPVIAANLGGMPHLIRDGQDGLLFVPDDVDDLTRCLQRVADDPAFLSRLANSIQPPRTVSDDVVDLLAYYRSAIDLAGSRHRVIAG